MALNEEWLNRELISDQFGNFSDFGSKDLSAGTYEVGGNRYEVSDTGKGGRIVRKVGSLADIRAEEDRQRAKQLQEQAISTLQGEKPKIGEIYAGKQQYLQSQIDPTKQRYDALLADIKAREQTSTEEQQRATNALLARRGIASDVGRGAQELIDVTQPIRREYGGLYTQTGLQQEEAIKAISDAIKLLAGEQAGQEINLAQAIAQAQLGAGGQAMQSYQTQAQLAQQAAQNKINQLLAEQSGKQSDIENQIKMAQLSLAQQSAPYELALLQAQANRANQPGGGIGTGSIDFQSLLDEYMRGLS